MKDERVGRIFFREALDERIDTINTIIFGSRFYQMGDEGKSGQLATRMQS